MAENATPLQVAANSHRFDARSAQLADAIEHAAHLLPSQGPISVFVHHNTLHAFEELTFTEAVKRGLETYGCQPYLSESRYRGELARGRIRHEDLAAVLQDDLGDAADELVGLLGARFHLRLAMLEHTLHSAPSAELRWVVAETEALRSFRGDVPEVARRQAVDSTRRWIMREYRNGAGRTDHRSAKTSSIVAELLARYGAEEIEDWTEEQWESFYLELLWRLCYEGVANAGPLRLHDGQPQRLHDVLLDATGKDSDDLVHDLLIRFTAAYLDQGFAHWPLPERDNGLFASFIALYGERGIVTPRWMRGLPQELRRQESAGASPLECIEESLDALGVDGQHVEEFIASTLLALPGWAGMIWQMETNAEWAVRPAPRGTLVEFLAIRLLLDRYAAAFVAAEELGYEGPLQNLAETARMASTPHQASRGVQQGFLFFQLAQVMDLRPEVLQELPAKTWAQFAREIDAFGELERRRVFHLAYERHYFKQALDAISIHTRTSRRRRKAATAPAPAFQLFCCIDDREESFRRHLEEADPECETFGYAGFYGVAMYYRGTADAHARPLCPVVIKPRHYVEELPVFTLEDSHLRRARTRRLIGAVSHQLHRGSRSLVGGAATALLGSLASAPLVGRILFPRTAAQLRRLFGRFVGPPEMTQLLIERTEPEPGPEDGHVGYTVNEMADIVERTLRDNGLTSRFAPLVIMCGHGSSSLNNPHESAYNCGACSGGRGGPNARAFAQMANDPRVRFMLEERGVHIPGSTHFLGGFHNTCNDAVVLFDLARLPATHKEAFTRAKRAIDEARQRNAHERCRRFESVGLTITPKAALAHSEERSEDLSQARPEYNHATNAVTFVGRRSMTRGLFMDRRCFLASYDPMQDDENAAILARVLSAVVPVCAGISLEYYFSTVDPQGYGCGSKLPHNIVSLLGVMEGAATDLRPGLSAQMVEIHEPLRNLFVIETTPEAMQRIMQGNATIGRLCKNDWVKLATLDPHDQRLHFYRDGQFEAYEPETHELPQVNSSLDWYRGWRDHLGYAQIAPPTSPAQNADATGEARS